MKGKTEQEKENDQTVLMAGALIAAGLFVLGIPPWIIFAM
jgi:hypothetical protein